MLVSSLHFSRNAVFNYFERSESKKLKQILDEKLGLDLNIHCHSSGEVIVKLSLH